jgi:hypothetical protein
MDIGWLFISNTDCFWVGWQVVQANRFHVTEWGVWEKHIVTQTAANVTIDWLLMCSRNQLQTSFIVDCHCVDVVVVCV